VAGGHSSTGSRRSQPRKEADHERSGVVQVYCEFCGRYVRVEHGDGLLICPQCGTPLMWHVVMDLG